MTSHLLETMRLQAEHKRVAQTVNELILSALWSATAYVSPETRRDTEVYE